MKALDSFFKMMQDEPARAFYGCVDFFNFFSSDTGLCIDCYASVVIVLPIISFTIRVQFRGLFQPFFERFIFC